jgi:K+-sensing histidine kinase KdpD
MGMQQLKNSKHWCNISKWLIYPICISIFLFIAIALFATGESFASENPYKFFYLAGIFLAYFFGFWPALCFIIGGTLFANFWFVPPFGEFIFSYHDLQVWLLNFCLGFTCIFFIEYLQRERYKNKLLLLVADSRYLILLHRDNDLMKLLKKDNHV